MSTTLFNRRMDLIHTSTNAINTLKWILHILLDYQVL